MEKRVVLDLWLEHRYAIKKNNTSHYFIETNPPSISKKYIYFFPKYSVNFVVLWRFQQQKEQNHYNSLFSLTHTVTTADIRRTGKLFFCLYSIFPGLILETANGRSGCLLQTCNLFWKLNALRHRKTTLYPEVLDFDKFMNIVLKRQTPHKLLWKIILLLKYQSLMINF